MSFDATDLSTLKFLMKRGRATWAELAEKLKLSAPAAADRVKRLEERGVIKGYAAVVDAELVGYGLTAFIAVNLQDHSSREKFLKRIEGLAEVAECHHVAGEHDFLLKVRCKGTRDLDRLLTEDLKGKAGVGRTHTTIVLATHRESVEVPLAY